MCLEEFKLLLARLACCDNLHDGLQCRIRPSSCRKHVNNRVGRRRGRGGRRWWRGCLYRLGGLWRSRLGLLMNWRSMMVLCMLVGLAVAMTMAVTVTMVVVRPWS